MSASLEQRLIKAMKAAQRPFGGIELSMRNLAPEHKDSSFYGAGRWGTALFRVSMSVERPGSHGMNYTDLYGDGDTLLDAVDAFNKKVAAWVEAKKVLSKSGSETQKARREVEKLLQ